MTRQETVVMWKRMVLFSAVALALPAACSPGATEPPASERQSALTSFGSSVSSAKLRLETLTNSCGANQAQDFFRVVNFGTTSIKTSDVTIKLWVNDTSASNIVPQISTGGCLTNAGGCFHQVSGVTAVATRFSPACGPDPAHQANWEITISNSDPTLIAGGVTWNNIQTALHLANYANFNPGTATWYSPCLAGGSYAPDSHFAVYVRGVLVASSAIAAPSCRAPRGTQPLQGYAVAPMSTAPILGPVAASQPVRLAITLPVRNAAGLAAFNRQVSDPASPTYGQFLTNQQFTDTYGPTAADYQALTSWAQANGLTVVRSFGDRTLLSVRGTADTVNRALFTNLVRRQRTDGTEFFSVDREPSLNLAPALLWIEGLSNFLPPRPASGSGVPSADGQAYLGDDFRNAYASCALKLTGSGQCVGIMAFAGFTASDIVAYENAAGRARHVPVTVVGETLPEDPDFTFEVTMDAEMAIAMAPGLSEVVMFENGGSSVEMLTEAANRQPRCNQLSSSFEYEFTLGAQQAVSNLVSRGISFYTASGDDGAYQGSGPTNSLAFADMTLVGGTTLTMNGAGASYASEITWNDDIDSRSGGGIVSFLDLPSFQMGIDMAAVGGSTIDRNSPDVAAVARNVEVFAPFNGGRGPWISGGTSASAPLWAGFTALINEQRGKGALAPLGYPAPSLYAVGTVAAIYPQVFNDITTGNNGSFNAAAGYDLTTGLGSPKCTLIYQLGSAIPTTPVPSTSVHVTGSATLITTDTGGQRTTTTASLDQIIPFSLGVRTGGYNLVVDSSIPAETGASLELAPNNVDVLTLGQGFQLGPAFVSNPGPAIRAGSSAVISGSASTGLLPRHLPLVSAEMSWSFTLVSSQP